MFKGRIIICCICFVFNLKAQLQVVPVVDVEDDLEALITDEVFGCDVNISNVSYLGNNQAIGGFSYFPDENLCSTSFGLNRGLIMTTGDIDYAVGPNNDGDNGQAWNEEYVDDFLHNYLVDFELITPSVNLYDACVLEFDISSSDFLSIDFEVIFGSEEYTEWMSPFYTDAFCFFVHEINGDIDPYFDSIPINIMETGNLLNDLSELNSCVIDNKPISPWTIRPYSDVFQDPAINECLYIDNQSGYNCDAIGYDGYTIPMFFNFSMLPNATYRIKMVIIDGVSDSWAGLDSGVFIKKSNINTASNLDFSWDDPEYDNLGATVSFNNISFNSNNIYLWDFNNDGVIDSNEPNPTYIFEKAGNHIVTLQVENTCTGLMESVSYELTIESFDDVGLIDMFDPLISISPNPAKENINISFSYDLGKEYLLELVDFSGRVVYKNYIYAYDKYVIRIDDLDAGIYYLRIGQPNTYIYYNKVMVL